ncbi:hypothetical protein D6C79_05153, partial [Aureobasidium pullulans]
MALLLPAFVLIVVIVFFLSIHNRYSTKQDDGKRPGRDGKDVNKSEKGESIYVTRLPHGAITDKPGEPATIDLSAVKPVATSFNWQIASPVPYRPWHNGPYHVTMGIKNTAIENWIEVDDTYLEKLTLKRELFEKHGDVTTQTLPGCEEAAFEGLHLLADYLPRRYPSMFRQSGENNIENMVTKETWDLARNASTWQRYHPLEVMGLLASEDFFLLQTDSQTGVSSLKAGAVCFPAGWKIQDRIGHSLWQIHAGKVPQYESKLAKSMDRFFVRMRVGSAITRFNYAIDDSNELFHPHSHHNLSAEKKVRLEDLHLRVERQFLQRLPKTRALLFSIRTYITPITEVTKDKEVAAALRNSVASYTDDVAKYK